MSYLVKVWHSYTAAQRKNIAIYIAGIMFYKLGLEFFNGSITTLATDRFTAATAFTKLGAAQGLNQAMQCVGAILIAPLAARFPTRSVLAIAVIVFGLMTTILLIVDAATGGSIRAPNGPVRYGNWNPDAIFPIWGLAGIAYGMVELIRRVIPADICGGNVNRLRRMDAMTHILYEVAGTSGAFASSAAITRFGNNYSFMLSPIFFAIAGVIWFFIIPSRKIPTEGQGQHDAALSAVEGKGSKKNYFVQLGYGVVLFGKSIWVGGKIIFGSRKFAWLFPCYAIALYLHRFLEASLAPAFARRVLNFSAWSQIMVGGSNFGELLGALTVFLMSDMVPTPIPWVRLDALMLNLVWVLPRFSQIASATGGGVRWAWFIAAVYIPISFGWAAGDVSLAAYIQSTLSDMNLPNSDVSPLGAVMGFLFSSYVILNAIMSSTLGKVIDDTFIARRSIYDALVNVGGIQFTVGCVIILAATFIPIGALALNPRPVGHLETRDDVNDPEHALNGAVLEQGGVLAPGGTHAGKVEEDEFTKPIKQVV